MNPPDQFSQQSFNTAGLIKAFAIGNDQIATFLTIATQSRSTPSRKIDVETAISVVTQQMLWKLAIKSDEVVLAYQPFLRAALLHLASNPAHWWFLGDASTLQAELFGNDQGAGLRRRRIQEMFDHQERATHRFLIRRPGERWTTSDDVGARVSSGDEPVVIILDAVAVADRVGAAFPRLFNWQA